MTAGGEDLYKLMQRAQMLMDVGRWREALHDLNLALARDPNNYNALCQAANCHLKLNQLQQALDRTKLAIETEPENEWAYRLRSFIYTENGERKRALEAARLCVEKAPYHFWSTHCLFWAEASYGNYDDAEKTLVRLKELMPESSSAHEAAGYLALKKKKFPDAEKHFLEALKMDPESVSALNNLGVIYLDYAQRGKGRHYQQKSVEMFQRAVRLQPTFTKGQQNIKAASKAVTIGVPAGGFLLIWLGIRLVTTVLSSAARGGPQVTSNDIVAFISPATPSYELTATNMFFLLFIVGLVVCLIILFTRFREIVAYEIATVRGWLIVSAAFGAISVAYVVGLWVLENDGTPFTGAAFTLSILIFLFFGIGAIQRLPSRPFGD